VSARNRAKSPGSPHQNGKVRRALEHPVPPFPLELTEG
jgi:hypothetical protein